MYFENTITMLEYGKCKILEREDLQTLCEGNQNRPPKNSMVGTYINLKNIEI